VTDVMMRRKVALRSRGQTHGPITRLVSPGDLGQMLKPFVFLDLFETGRTPSTRFPFHPHSGIATLTYLTEGWVDYEDSTGASGRLTPHGAEWVRAGSGVWHTGSPGQNVVTKGFQLWLALPPELELEPSVSIYNGAEAIPVVGPARVLLGHHEGASGPIPSPAPITYLGVDLPAGERWSFEPPENQTVLWIAIATGAVTIGGETYQDGEIVVFEPGEGPVEFEAVGRAEFVLGSAQRHDHDLVLGYYSVHTSAEALRRGEAGIQTLGEAAGYV